MSALTNVLAKKDYPDTDNGTTERAGFEPALSTTF